MQQIAIEINKVPDDSKIRKRIKPLGSKDTVKYRLYNSYNPVTKKYNLRDVCIPNRDIVTDPETGKTYEIAFVKNYGPNMQPVFGDIWFDATGLCQFTLHGNRVQHRKIYDFIEMSNYLADNPNRDQSAPILIERVDESTDSNTLRKIRKNKQQAFNLVDTMSDEEITSFLRANNMPVGSSEFARRDTVEEMIEKGEAEKLLKSSVSSEPTGADHAKTIEALKKSERIAYDKTTRSWTAKDGTLLFILDKGIGKSPVGDFAKFLTTKKGAESLVKLKGLEGANEGKIEE